MKQCYRWMAVVGILSIASMPGWAEMTTTLRKGLNMNWFYRNTDSSYPRQVEGPGYFIDYNKDGLLDYLILLRNSTTCNWRLFALNTAATGGEKTYAAHKTAGRDFAASFGSFVPKTLSTPQAPSMTVPDLVIVGTNQAAAGADFTQYKFRRLKETDPAFPDDGSILTISGVSKKYNVYWPDCSFNSDDYPDFFIYNSEPIAGKFTVKCYNGKLTSSTPLWTRQLSLDSEDPGTGVMVGDTPMLTPYLNVLVLPKLGNNWQSSDFDGNGKPEIFLYYSFGKGTSYADMTAVLDINLLNSSGGFVSPYTSTWTRIGSDIMASTPPSPMVTSDYNQDGYVDMVIMRMNFMTPTPPVFEAYNLKGRASLFKTENKDFSASGLSTPTPLELYNFVPYLHNKYQPAGSADLSGDGYNDLDVYRQNASPPSMPLRVGLFHGYAAGGANKGRRMWLQTFTNYNAANWNANDFDGDNMMDYVLAKNPDAPSTPTLNKVTWRLATTSVKKTGISILKEFTYAPSHEFGAYNKASDDFQAYSGQFARLGDLDGDGRRDTCGSFQCGFDRGDNGSTDLSYGFLVVYDNTPGAAAPDITAELEIKIKNEDWTPYPIMMYAIAPDMQTLVDNNGDGSVNDIVVKTEKAVHALSFKYKPVTTRNAARGWGQYR